MAQYITALLVFCLSAGSLGTTHNTSSQQESATAKDLCKESMIGHGLPGIPGSNGMPGMPGVPGLQGPQGREGAKGQTGDKGAQGTMGMKGELGIMGAQGLKGGKGEKGESSAVPQTNWKQCVWKKDDSTDSGQIKNCSFNKLQSDAALKVSFQGIMSVYGSNIGCSRWYFKFDGQECSGPMTIEAIVYNNWPSSAGSPWLLHHRSFEGYCENIPQGAVSVELWVGKCDSYPLTRADTGWISVSRIIIEEVPRSQS